MRIEEFIADDNIEPNPDSPKTPPSQEQEVPPKVTPTPKQRGKDQRKKDFAATQPQPSTSTGRTGLPRPVFLSQALDSSDSDPDAPPPPPFHMTATPWGDKMMHIKRKAKAKQSYKY